MVEILTFTQPNPALKAGKAKHGSDVPQIWQGRSTFAANLMEYAARLCYASTARMGTSPSFISARVREGHEDIIEHVVITLRWRDTDEPAQWRMESRHCEVSRAGDREWVVTGNARVWLNFFKEGIALEALPLVRQIVPEVYAGLPETFVPTAPLPEPVNASDHLLEELAAFEAEPLRVTLLGYSQPLLRDTEMLADHGSACFLFEGISRACTHQLVRHRLASFSQESQRYVELQKGGWNAVAPPRIQALPEAQAILDRSWQLMQENYQALRDLGIRKEDARFLLPNAAETRIVTAMNFRAWQHFLWLRAVDKAAQWEIRHMGLQVLRMLYAVAPTVFCDHWDVHKAQLAKAQQRTQESNR